MNAPRLTIYFDGDCPFCSAGGPWLKEPRDER